MTGYDDDSEGLDFMTNNAQFFNDETTSEDNYSSGDEYGSSGSGDSADYYDTWQIMMVVGI